MQYKIYLPKKQEHFVTFPTSSKIVFELHKCLSLLNIVGVCSQNHCCNKRRKKKERVGFLILWEIYRVAFCPDVRNMQLHQSCSVCNRAALLRLLLLCLLVLKWS